MTMAVCARMCVSIFALQLTCGSCPICAEPDPVPDIQVIVQSVAITDTLASVWLLADFPVAGVQAESVCRGESEKESEEDDDQS